eukprot:scaffold10688_cov51-Phaeocystis_antarctica.AAC.1
MAASTRATAAAAGWAAAAAGSAAVARTEEPMEVRERAQRSRRSWDLVRRPAAVDALATNQRELNADLALGDRVGAGRHVEFAREGQARLPDHANPPVRCRHAGALLLPGPTAANATSSILFLVDQMRLIEANARDLGHLDVQLMVAR